MCAKCRVNRVKLEMKLMKYRALARDAADEVTTQRVTVSVAELWRKPREIDE
jgi:hypothetical protein